MNTMLNIKRPWAILFAFLIAATTSAQVKQVTIEQCFEWAKQNYPLIKKHDLIARSSGYAIENAGRLYWPQVSVNGQATYQSETISFPDALSSIPGISFPEISKDQYKIQGEIIQQIYDGGRIKNQKESLRTTEQIQQQSVEVNIYTLKERVTQLYFSILLMKEQQAQNELRETTLQSAADKAMAAYEQGAAFRSNVDELKAEVANAEMSNIEFRSNRGAYLEMLSLLTGKILGEKTEFILPAAQISDPVIKRPELTLFDLQKRTYEVQEKQLQSDYLPKLNAFIQGAYGRPTLNIIEDKAGPWWVGGLRLSWNLGSLYTLKNSRDILKINQDALDVDKEVFIYNTRLSLSQQNSDAQKYTEMMRQDDTIITLRASVTKSAQAQLDNGVITVHDYISKLDAENMARQARILHKTQLLQAQYDYKNTSGN